MDHSVDEQGEDTDKFDIEYSNSENELAPMKGLLRSSNVGVGAEQR